MRLLELESDLSQWHIFHDHGYTEGNLQVFGHDTGYNVLAVTLTNGTQSYANVLAYHDLPAVNDATLFSMDASFLYQRTDATQGLEFTMDKWVNNVRWEWALQWQAVPDGTPLSAPPMTWRVWNGSHWQSIQVLQNLPPNTLHTFHLYGNIVNNQVHYIGFYCDTLYINISQLTFNPVPSPGNKLSVGVQIDGNYQEAAYTVFYHDINFYYL